MRIRIDIKGKGPIFVPGRVLSEVSNEMETAVRQAGKVMQASVRRAITDDGLINTGALRNSIQDNFLRETPLRMLTSVGTTLEYAAPMELGTKPFWPSRTAIEGPLTLWARRKLGLPEKAARRAAWAIAVTISRRGLRARNFFSRGIKEAMIPVDRILKEAMRRAIGRLNG